MEGARDNSSMFSEECGYHISDSILYERKGNADTDGDHFAVAPESTATLRTRADNNKSIVGHRLLFLRRYSSAFSMLRTVKAETASLVLSACISQLQPITWP